MITTTAPAKIILFGEHAVNRQQPTIVTALDARTRCVVQPGGDARVLFRSGTHLLETDCAELRAFTQTIDALRGENNRAAIREHAQDYFAPAKYVFYMEEECVRWLIDEKKMRAFGTDSSSFKVRGVSHYPNHRLITKAAIPVLECMTHLQDLKKQRVFLIALPIPVVGLDACPVRAIAIEPSDNESHPCD